MGLNQAQLKLLIGFCSDIAKGALLAGLGYTYALPVSLEAKIIFSISAILVAILVLLLALRIAKTLEE